MGNGERYRLSRYTNVVRGEDLCVLGNGLALQRVTLDGSFAALSRVLEAESFTVDDLRAASPPAADAAGVLDFLLERELAVPAAMDEERRLAERLAERGEQLSAAAPGRRWPAATHYWQPAPLAPSHLAAGSGRPLRMLLVGGCVLQFAEETIVRAGRARGYDFRVHHVWPPLQSSAKRLFKELDPDLTVVQLSVHPLMASLWDMGALVDAQERGRRLQDLRSLLGSMLERTVELLAGRAGAVHNFAPPAVSPFGRSEFRTPLNFRQLVYELNHYVDEATKPHDNLIVVDEERLVARHGALFDELVLPFGHHGGVPDGDAPELTQRSELSEALAAEYLDCFEILSGETAMKAVAVDLDGTLWPGVVAEDGFGWLERDDPARWVSLGLHQALRILKQRGILLLGCSKGTPEATLEPWRNADHALLLRPDDFVALEISWRPKSVVLARLCESLGLDPARLVFLDDNPVERAEVREHLPAVSVPALPVAELRAYLLTSPRFELARLTEEAADRTETTKAMLARAALRDDADMDEFLRSLEVELTVDSAKEHDLPRVCELVRRATQFTTTGRELSRSEAEELIARPDAELLVLRVRDRLADYGLVGVCMIEGALVSKLVVSCRVIGLDVGAPFLAACLRRSSRARAGTRGALTPTLRNAAARDVFLEAGFAPAGSGGFVLEDGARLREPDSFPHRIRIGGMAA